MVIKADRGDPDNHGTHDPALADHSSGIYGIWAAGKEIVSGGQWSAGNVSGICSTASSLYERRAYFGADIPKHYPMGGKGNSGYSSYPIAVLLDASDRSAGKNMGRLVAAWDYRVGRVSPVFHGNYADTCICRIDDPGGFVKEEKYFLSGAWNRGLYSLYYFRSLLYLSDPLMLTEKNFERI